MTQWSKVTNSALLQVGNPSDRNIILKPNTIVGTITPVTAISPRTASAVTQAISPRTASAVTQNCSESSQARIDLTAALDESFKNTTFDDQQRAQIINLCTEYRSVFSLNQKELGKCTIAEAEFPLQKDTKPVDRHPYRTVGCTYSQVRCKSKDFAKYLGTGTGRCFYQSKRVINLCPCPPFSPIPQAVYNPCRRK